MEKSLEQSPISIVLEKAHKYVRTLIQTGQFTRRKYPQHNHHVIAWLKMMSRHVTEQRRKDKVYRLKVSRMTQLNHPLVKNDHMNYSWLKEYWREELEHKSETP